MKKLIIIGARGFGREVCNIARQTGQFEIKGFLDDKSDALSEFSGYPPILSSVENYVITDEDFFICALGDVKFKKKYINLIIGRGGRFTNVIHPSVIINQNVKLGLGIILCPFTYISNEVTIGNFVTIQTHSAIGHDVQIGDYCMINALTFLGGFAKLEEGVTINPGATVLPKSVVGENSTIGINSSVLKDVRPNHTVYGNPAVEIF